MFEGKAMERKEGIDREEQIIIIPQEMMIISMLMFYNFPSNFGRDIVWSFIY